MATVGRTCKRATAVIFNANKCGGFRDLSKSVSRRYYVGVAWGSYGIKPHDVVVTLILIKEVRTPRSHMVFGVGHVDA